MTNGTINWMVAALVLLASTSVMAGDKAAQAQKTAKAAAQKSVAQKSVTQKSAAPKDATQKAAQKGEEKTTWEKIAANRAARMAARNYRGHLPGIPAGCFEGVGWGGWDCATCVGSGVLLADAQVPAADGTVYRVRLWSNGPARARMRVRLFRRRR